MAGVTDASDRWVIPPPSPPPPLPPAPGPRPRLPAPCPSSRRTRPAFCLLHRNNAITRKISKAAPATLPTTPPTTTPVGVEPSSSSDVALSTSGPPTPPPSPPPVPPFVPPPPPPGEEYVVGVTRLVESVMVSDAEEDERRVVDEALSDSVDMVLLRDVLLPKPGSAC